MKFLGYIVYVHVFMIDSLNNYIFQEKANPSENICIFPIISKGKICSSSILIRLIIPMLIEKFHLLKVDDSNSSLDFKLINFQIWMFVT